ncbi:MAG: DUF4340 domain-containing protein [Bacteroidetes bacterium]|nr:DUF4340 domain-containing protein [Bacteroidota bacterium]
MIKKTKTWLLGLILGVLLILVVVILYNERSTDPNTFRSELVEIDSSAVTEIIISPRAAPEELVRLMKQGEKWVIEVAKDKVAETDHEMISAALGTLINLKALRLAADSESKLSEYQVDEAGTRVKLMAGADLIVDIIFGKFEYKDQRSMFSYVRLADEVKIYAVDGLPDMSFNRPVAAWRNQSVLQFNVLDIGGIEMINPDEPAMILSLNEQGWLDGNQPADSIAVANYLNSISNVSSGNFLDHLEESSLGSPAYELKVKTDDVNFIHIRAFDLGMIDDTTTQYLINSSQNPASYFDGSVDGLFEKLFVNRSRFKLE